MNTTILRIKRVKFLFEHGQISNLDATHLLNQKLHNMVLAHYVFRYTILRKDK